jgi:hypothetical protein|tara:strand:+ start:640 stop:930 length:291 start_codon:yes stop_codon:yes gene_type:complete
MRAHLGIFRKKDGSIRTMRFVTLDNLPEGFFISQTKGTGKKRTLVEGNKLVWDLDKQGFRVFNRNTIIGEIEDFNIESLENFEQQNKTSETRDLSS